MHARSGICAALQGSGGSCKRKRAQSTRIGHETAAPVRGRPCSAGAGSSCRRSGLESWCHSPSACRPAPTWPPRRAPGWVLGKGLHRSCRGRTQQEGQVAAGKLSNSDSKQYTCLLSEKTLSLTSCQAVQDRYRAVHAQFRWLPCRLVWEAHIRHTTGNLRNCNLCKSPC